MENTQELFYNDTVLFQADKKAKPERASVVITYLNTPEIVTIRRPEGYTQNVSRKQLTFVSHSKDKRPCHWV